VRTDFDQIHPVGVRHRDTGSAAFIELTSATACYTALAINQADTLLQADTPLYAANDAGAGRIEVYNSS
jgi:hypothetical protein